MDCVYSTSSLVLSTRLLCVLLSGMLGAAQARSQSVSCTTCEFEAEGAASVGKVSRMVLLACTAEAQRTEGLDG